MRQETEPYNPMTLRFLDKRTERQFQDYDFHTGRSTHVPAVLLCMALYYGYTLVDIMLFDEWLSITTIIRWCTLPASILTLKFAAQNTNPQRHQVVMFTATCLFTIVLASGVWTHDESYTVFFCSGMAITYAYGALLLNLSMLNCVILILGMNGFVMLGLGIQHPDSEYLVENIHILALLALYTLFAVYRSELIRRQTFIQNRAFSLQQQALRKAEKDRTEWFKGTTNFLRHELRNSIRGISSSIEMFLRFNPQYEDDKYIERSKLGLKLSNRMLKDMSNATNLRNILSTEPKEWMSLNQCISTLVSSSGAHSAQNPIYFDDKVRGCFILGNPERVHEAFENLIVNAIDHATPQSPITIALRQSPHWYEVSVTNYGSPLPEDTSDIFHPFVSKRNTEDKSKDNMGIGLFVVQAVVENCGGTVNVFPTSEETGARFLVKFPRKPDAIEVELLR